MGGAIGVVSTPGAGSTFWFEIPLQAAERPADAAAIGSAQEPQRRLRILVAEDVAVNQKVVRGMLRSLGYQTINISYAAP